MTVVLDRDTQLHILRRRGWTIDQRHEYGIAPGKLDIPQLSIPPPEIICNTGYSSLYIELPNNKVYQIDRWFDPHGTYYREKWVQWTKHALR